MGRARPSPLWLLLGLGAYPFSAAAQSVLPEAAELQPVATKPSVASERDDPKGPSAIAPEEPQANVFVPLLMYTPETHVGFGGLFVRFFRPAAPSKRRVSSFAFFAIATTRRQAILEAHPDVYAFADALHLFGKVEYQYFPDSFWGVGPHTEDEDEERYKRERFRLKTTGHYRLFGPLHAGIGLDVMAYKGTYADDGIFANETFIGEDGGITTGFGPSAVYDTRDSTVNARSGALIAFNVLWFPPKLSDYHFQKFLFEGRQFFDLGNRHALGARVYGEFQGGEVPYYQLAMLGGDEMLRGYYLGRYRDETLAVAEAEYRYPIYWKFSGVAFAGAGSVAPDASDLLQEPIRWAVGGGARFSLSDQERLNLRFDAGFGIGTWGFYFTAREAF